MQTLSILSMAMSIAISFPNVSSMPAANSRCLLCDDLNRKSDNQCVNNYNNCGKCKFGFIEDFDDPRLCLTIEVIETPENANLNIHSEVHLPCKFNTKVNCYWTKDGRRLQIMENSKVEFYDSKAHYEKCQDCSLRIRELQKSAEGSYVCGSLADSNSYSVESQAIRLTINTPTEVTTQFIQKRETDIILTSTINSSSHNNGKHGVPLEDETPTNNQPRFFEPIVLSDINIVIVILLSAILAMLLILLVIFVVHPYYKLKGQSKSIRP